MESRLLECGTCHWGKPTASYSPKARERQDRMCFDCRMTREKNRLAALEVGKQMCARCDQVFDKTEFPITSRSVVSCYCRPCSNARQRAFQKCAKEKATHAICNMCKVDKPIDQFSTGGKDRVDYRCKECRARRAAMGRTTHRSRWTMAKASAKKRGIEFSLTVEELATAREGNCSYCGHPTSVLGAGLDRSDSSKGYIPGNVVPCCPDCNAIRSDFFTPDEMRILGEVVGRIKTARIAAGIPMARRLGRPKKYARDD